MTAARADSDGRLPPLLVFHHIPKTAGTSLRQVMRANYRRRECAWLYRLDRDSLRGHRRWYETLRDEDKGRLRCVASHTANLLVPVLDRPCSVFTLLRDPVARALSSYHFMRSRAAEASRRGRPPAGAGERIGRIILERQWTIEALYAELAGGAEGSSDLHLLFRTFFNGQARSLLAPHVDTGALTYSSGPAAGTDFRDLAMRLSSEQYLVGVQELFAQSLVLFASSFGWRHLFAPRRNVNRAPGAHDIAPETRELIRAYNWLDAELHEHHSERLLTVRPPRLPSAPARSAVSRIGDAASRRFAPSAT